MKFIIHSKKYGDKEVLIDKEDYHFILEYHWYICKWGKVFYVVATVYNRETKKQRTVKLHRLILNAPKNKDIDHKNGNGLDNRKKNLRLCTKVENGINRGKQKNNTSGYKGVWQIHNGRWRARIHFKKSIHLGYFDTIKEAHQAYCKASKKYHGEFRRME
jgi:hypothetical protein